MATCMKLSSFICHNCRSLQSGSFSFSVIHQWNLIYRTKRLTHKYTHLTDSPDNVYAKVYTDLHGTIEDSEIARDFARAIKPSERMLLLEELRRYEELHGREPVDVQAPSSSQLLKVALHTGLPFIGFGFLDNFLMITAGEYLDVTLGTTLCISTMAAAAIGNWISDLAGLGMANFIESSCSKFGVRAPPLSPEQYDMKSTQWFSRLGRVIGISIGCIIGMCPLLFFDDRKKETSEKETQAETEE